MSEKIFEGLVCVLLLTVLGVSLSAFAIASFKETLSEIKMDNMYPDKCSKK